MFSAHRSDRSRLFRKPAQARILNARRARPLVEPLEELLLLATIGGGGGGGGGGGPTGGGGGITVDWTWTDGTLDQSWETPGNWTVSSGGPTGAYPGEVPDEVDVVTIDTGNAPDTVNLSSQVTIQSLTTTANDTLNLFGSLTLTGGSTLAGPLDLSNGSLTASGAGVSVVGGGAATAYNAFLAAQNGATLSLPGLTTSSGFGTLTATGPGSVLDVSALATISDGGGGSTPGPLQAVASQGGEVNLSALTSFDGSSSSVVIDTLGTLDFPGSVDSMTATGPAVVANAPALPQGATLTLVDQTAYPGGTTFNIGPGAVVVVPDGTYAGGASFNTSSGATVSLTGGTFSGTLTGTGPGTVQVGSGRVYVGPGGLTLDFPAGQFQWTSGVIDGGSGVLTNLGTMTLAGNLEKDFYNDGLLDNLGTLIQSGSGALVLGTDGLFPTTLRNEAGARYLIEGDGSINEIVDGGRSLAAGQTSIDNLGLFQKVSGTGTSSLYVAGAISNTGTMEADSGTLWLEPDSGVRQLSGGVLTQGTWQVLGAATLAFPATFAANQADISLSGAGAALVAMSSSGGATTPIGNTLTSSSGRFTLTGGASFSIAGDFANTGSLTLGAGSVLSVAGNYTQATSTATLNTALGGTPASGQYGRVAVTGTAALAGDYSAAIVSGFAPSPGQDFQPLTFAGATGTFASFSGLGPFFTEALNPTSLDLVDSATSAVDLSTSNVTAPGAAAAGQAVTLSWRVADTGAQAASGNWLDRVYLSPTPTITSNSILLGTVEHTGGLGAGGSYTGTWSGAMPAVEPGVYYVLAQADSLDQQPDPDRSNNTAAASGSINVALPTLALDTPYADAFTAADQDHYYQVTVPAGGTLRVSLSSAASSGSVALYISRGVLPSPFGFDEAATAANQPSQTATVPQVLSAGTYDILAHSVAGAAATAGFTLTASQSSALSVSGTSAGPGGNAGNVTIEIDGANLSGSAAASLSLNGQTFNDTSVDYVSSSKIFATFNLKGAAPGSYVLSVQQGGQSVQAPATFPVVAAAAGALTFQLSVPQYVRSLGTGTVVVTYTNPTKNDLVAPLLTLASTNSAVYFSTPDDPSRYLQSAEVLAVESSGPAGILRPGQSGHLTLTLLSGDPADQDQLPIQVGVIEPGQAIDWAAQKATLQPPGVPPAAWNGIWQNLMAQVGSTTDSYDAALAGAATYLGDLGEGTAQLSDVGRLYSFLYAQADAEFPATTLATGKDASLPTPGAVGLAITRTFLSTLAGRSQTGLFGLGWVSSWDDSLSTDAAGNVTILTSGSRSVFTALPGGTYQATDGTSGTLTPSAGGYTVTLGSGTRLDFLADGKLNFEQDASGNRITAGYNAQNQLVTLTYSNPSGGSAQLTLAYNAEGHVSQVDDGNGDVWTYAYDGAGHLLSVTSPGGLATTYTYDTGSNPATANALLSIGSADGTTQSFTYDAEGRLSTASSNGGSGALTYTYPDEAEVTSSDAAGDQSTTWYNELGRPARFQDPLGNIASAQFDTSGNAVSYTDAGGNTYRYVYDRNGNLTATILPSGQTVQSTYGTLGNLTSSTDGAGNTTSYHYDGAGNLLSITYPDGGQQSFSYDPLGQVSTSILANGDPIDYTRNAQGLVTRESFADGTSETFSYDARGNMLTAATFDANGTPTGTTALTYNTAGETTSVTYPNGQYLDFTYDPATGLRTQSVDQSGYTINYGYDALGRLSSLTDKSGNVIVSYTYNALDQLQEKNNGNGTYTTYAYNAAGELTQEINHASGGTINSTLTYTYNALHQETSSTDASGTTTYSYDSTGRLTGIGLPGGATITYAYNAAGDRTAVIDGGTTTAYSSNGDNQTTQVGTATYTYDANGNLHTVTDSGGTTTYDYNDLNQLVSIQAPDGTTTAFQYSPLGFLVGQTVTQNGVSTSTSYLVDPTGQGNVVASYGGSGNLIADYAYGRGLVSQTGAAGTGYYDFDASGNVVGITGASGSYVNQYSYLPFGEATATISPGLANPFTFSGESGALQLAPNLFSLRARDYDTTTGQFTSRDPSGLLGGSYNLYSYSADAPTQYIDPTGTELGLAAFGAGAGAAAGGISYLIGQGLSGQPVTLGGFLGGVTSGAITGAVAGLTNGMTLAPGANAAVGAAANVAGTFVQGLCGDQVNGYSYANSIATGALGGAFGGPIGNLVTKIPGASSTIEPALTGAENALLNNLDRGILPGAATNALGNLLPTKTQTNGPNGNTTNVTSHDPNALIGPGGYGAANYLQPEGTWGYTIDFENDGSAAAQTVTVTEQLDSNLDWSTFELGSFGWGTVVVPVPAGLTRYDTTVAYDNSDGTALNVKVDLDFNVQTGVLTASFTSLDPVTGTAPTGALDGFLYPSAAGLASSEGYVQYTVAPTAGLTTGTTITQQASVVFDTNPPIVTAPFVDTIDAGAPTSTMAALPATESSSSFVVSWSGQDDAGGSGLASIDVYVSEDGGPPALFVHDTNPSQLSAPFNGLPGHTYAFYSIATDNVGHVQATPATAQASTQVVVLPTLTWTNPADLTYGTALGGTQLNATASAVVDGQTVTVPGSFSYTLADGTTPATNAVLHAGQNQVLNVTFTPADPSAYSGATAQVEINVDPALLTVTANSPSTVYGNTLPSLAASYGGFVNNDTLGTSDLSGAPALSTSASLGSWVGGYAINVSQGTLASKDYTFKFVPSLLTITQRPLTVTAAANSKTYDATTSALAVPAITSGTLFGTDTATFTESYDTKNVGSGKTLTPAGSVNDGDGGQNYSVLFVPANLGTVTQAAVSASGITAESRMYDGKTDATLNTAAASLSGVFPKDDVGLSTAAAIGTFADRNVGPNKLVQVSGLTLVGSDAGNYVLTQPTTTASITQAPLTITAVANTKTYDGTTTALATPTVAGLQPGDSVTDLAESYSDASVGTGKALSVSSFTVGDGNGGQNYSVTTLGNTSGAIDAATPVVGVSDLGGTYNGAPFTASATVAGISGVAGTSLESVTPVLAYYSGTTLLPGAPAAAGTYTVVASFPGSPDYAPATSSTQSFTIALRPTTTTLVSSNPTPTPGQSVTFTATVAGGLAAPDLPTGTVQFQVNGQNVGSPVGLSTSGTASIDLPAPTSSSYTVTAVYSGDSDFAASTSPGVTSLVLQPGVYTIGTTLYVIGADTSDAALIVPWGSQRDGSTGLAVAAELNRTLSLVSFRQSFTAIVIYGYGGNDFFQLAPTLTLPTTVVEGNGNDSIGLAGGNDTVTLGTGTYRIVGLDGDKTITATDHAGTNNSITLGAGNETISLGDGNDQVVLGSRRGGGFGPGGDDGRGVNLFGGSASIGLFGIGLGWTGRSWGGDDGSHEEGDRGSACSSPSGTATITMGAGNDSVLLGDGASTVSLGDGNDRVSGGKGADTVTLGNGDDSVELGDGDNTVTLGNGDDSVELGDGDNVVVEGNGNDRVSAGNGSNLVVGGLGPHTIRLGNGNNILIDGSAVLTQPGDTLRQVLTDWNGSASTNVDGRLAVTYNVAHPSALSAGRGRDWYFFTSPKTRANPKRTDRVN